MQTENYTRRPTKAKRMPYSQPAAVYENFYVQKLVQLILPQKRVEFLNSIIKSVAADYSDRNTTKYGICKHALSILNDEGIVEHPVKTKCDHIFGNLCIPKWLRDSDTCPECRDEVFQKIAKYTWTRK